eukprot:132742-Alexandrium_andersonii.AAC.1
MSVASPRPTRARLTSLALHSEEGRSAGSVGAPWWRCTLCNVAIRDEEYPAQSELPSRHRSHLSEARRRHS